MMLSEFMLGDACPLPSMYVCSFVANTSQAGQEAVFLCLNHVDPPLGAMPPF